MRLLPGTPYEWGEDRTVCPIHRTLSPGTLEANSSDTVSDLHPTRKQTPEGGLRPAGDGGNEPTVEPYELQMMAWGSV